MQQKKQRPTMILLSPGGFTNFYTEKNNVTEPSGLLGSKGQSLDGSPLTTLTEVTEKDKLEKACMEE
eukprot:12797200-Ditylum_brightwellii.AAC.1